MGKESNKRYSPKSTSTVVPEGLKREKSDAEVSRAYDGSASSVTLDAWDYHDPLSFLGWDLLATDVEWFDLETPSGGDWVSRISLTYNFGSNPNWLEFRVSGNFPGSPIAWVEINNGGPE